MQPLYVNGKFAAQATTGVQRYAAELLRAVDDSFGPSPPDRPWVLLCPPGARPPPLRHVEVRPVGPRLGALHAWEQLVLPLAARGGLLLNLAGSAPLLRRRQVCTFHDAAVFDQPAAYTRAFVAWYRLLFRVQARRAARLLTVSAFSATRLAAALRLRAADLAIVPNGAEHLDAAVPDPQVLRRLGLEGARYFLAVGSTNPGKNLARLVEAFAGIPGELRLVVVGGAHPAVFAAGPLPAADARVLYAGPQDDAALKALYGGAVALVFPSLYEGFGLPPVEAMACGCPVAAARAASLPEVCGDAALYFDPLSVADIAAALRRLAQDEALRGTLAAAGRARAGHWRWARSAALLRQAVGGLA